MLGIFEMDPYWLEHLYITGLRAKMCHGGGGRQGGQRTEVRLGDNVVILTLKLSKDECGFIRLQIDFVLDM